MAPSSLANITTPEAVTNFLCGEHHHIVDSTIGIIVSILILALQLGLVVLVVCVAGVGHFQVYWRTKDPHSRLKDGDRTSLAATRSSMRRLVMHRTSGDANKTDIEEDQPIREKLQSVCISAINLDYQVKSLVQKSYLRSKLPGGKPEMHKILHGVTCTFRPGNLTAIMGPSGCGKTTLLNLAAGQTAMGEVSGIRAINGYPIYSPRKYRKAMQRVGGYMQQVDVQFEELSVEETLYFTGRLVLSYKTPEELRESVYDALLAMDLLAARDAPVGGKTFAGISGGQRRRLSLAQQLLDGPPVIIADEPTSGLDATSSLNIVSKLSEMAKLGHTVMLTIHQPRQEIIDLFDRLLLLVEGRTAFMGPVADAAAFFDYSGLPSKPLSMFTNVGDFIGDAVDEEKSRLREKKVERTLTTLWKEQENGVVEYLLMKETSSSEDVVHAFEKKLASSRSSEGKKSASLILPSRRSSSESMGEGVMLGSKSLPEDFSQIRGLLKEGPSGDDGSRAEFETLIANGRKSAPFFTEFCTVSWRVLYRSWFGSWKYCVYFIAQVALTSLVLWWAFRSTLSSSKPNGDPSRNFVTYLTAVAYQIYFATLYTCSIQYLFIVPITFSERDVFKHERQGGQQRSSVHVLALAVADTIPTCLAFTIVYAICFVTYTENSTYQSPTSGALIFMLSTGVFAFNAITALVCQLTSSMDAAYALMFLVLAGGGLFSGMVVGYGNLGFWKWLYFADPVSWISRSVIQNVLGYSFVFTDCRTATTYFFAWFFNADMSTAEAGEGFYEYNCLRNKVQPSDPLNVGLAMLELVFADYFGFHDACPYSSFWVLAIFFVVGRVMCLIVIRARIATSFNIWQVTGPSPSWSVAVEESSQQFEQDDTSLQHA